MKTGMLLRKNGVPGSGRHLPSRMRIPLKTMKRASTATRSSCCHLDMDGGLCFRRSRGSVPACFIIVHEHGLKWRF